MHGSLTGYLAMTGSVVCLSSVVYSADDVGFCYELALLILGVFQLFLLPDGGRLVGGLLKLAAKVGLFAIANQLGNLGNGVAGICNDELLGLLNSEVVYPSMKIHSLFFVDVVRESGAPYLQVLRHVFDIYFRAEIILVGNNCAFELIPS